MKMAARSDEVVEGGAGSTMRRLGFVPALDGLRGVAVLVVVVHHLPAVVPSFKSMRPHGGYLGVDIFFVLSGFLITALLCREQLDTGKIRFRLFYARRALRLLPALVILLIVYDAYMWMSGRPLNAPLTHSVAILFYVQNLPHLFHASTPAFAPLWSLAVEEQFYIVWPVVFTLLFGIRRRTWAVATLMVAAIVAINVHQALAYRTARGIFLIPLYNRTDYRASSILVGALLALLWVRGKTPTRGLRPAAWIAFVFAVACIARLRVTEGYLYRGGFTVFAIAVAVIILAILESSWVGGRVLTVRPLRAIGRVSYGLYLWHMPIFLIVYRYASHLGGFPRLFLGLAASAAVTYASWTLVERPILRWKSRHVEPRGAPAPAPD